MHKFYGETSAHCRLLKEVNVGPTDRTKVGWHFSGKNCIRTGSPVFQEDDG